MCVIIILEGVVVRSNYEDSLGHPILLLGMAIALSSQWFTLATYSLHVW
jgi:hypothetical protein